MHTYKGTNSWYFGISWYLATTRTTNIKNYSQEFQPKNYIRKYRDTKIILISQWIFSRNVKVLSSSRNPRKQNNASKRIEGILLKF